MMQRIMSATSGVWRLANTQQNFPKVQRYVHQMKTHQPNNLEKKFLVWGGKYPSVDQVPSHVSCEEMERCRNRVRIRLANIMMALTVVGCVVMVYSGKQASKRGESVSKQNMEWHKNYNEDSTKNDDTAK